MSRSKKIAQTILFMVYCALILWETLLKRNVSFPRTYEFRIFWGFTDLITGKGNGKYVSLQYFQNVLFFIPFGFLFPWKQRRWIAVVCACVFSSLIETTQYVTARGLCELDDIIANTIGAAVGMGLCAMAIKLKVKNTRR